MTRSKQPDRVWQGIQSPEPPACYHDFRRLLAMVETMLAARVKGFPAKIANGTLLEADARAEIAAFEDMRADWRFIASGGADGEPAHPASIGLRRRLLDASLETIADIVREQGGEFSDTLSAQAEAVIALRWHLEPGRDQVALARLTHELRKRAKRSAQFTTAERKAAA